MTVLFVVFTLMLFLTADYFVQRAKARRTQEVSDIPPAHPLFPLSSNLPVSIALASNHTWWNDHGDGTATIGVDEFLGKVLGVVDRIILPGVGEELNPSAVAVSMRNGEKALRLAIPVPGRVVSVNSSLLKDTALARRDPYGAGWLLRVQKDSDGEGLERAKNGGLAIRWLERQSELAKEFFSAHGPRMQFATMQDGGELVDGYLKDCDARVWREFQKSFATLRSNH